MSPRRLPEPDRAPVMRPRVWPGSGQDEAPSSWRSSGWPAALGRFGPNGLSGLFRHARRAEHEVAAQRLPRVLSGRARYGGTAAPVYDAAGHGRGLQERSRGGACFDPPGLDFARCGTRGLVCGRCGALGMHVGRQFLPLVSRGRLDARTRLADAGGRFAQRQLRDQSIAGRSAHDLLGRALHVELRLGERGDGNGRPALWPPPSVSRSCRCALFRICWCAEVGAGGWHSSPVWWRWAPSRRRGSDGRRTQPCMANGSRICMARWPRRCSGNSAISPCWRSCIAC